MTKTFGVAILMLLVASEGPAMAADVHSLPQLPARKVSGDWLVDPVAARAGAYRSADGSSIVLDNGLIRRTIRVVDGAATVAMDNLTTGASLLRAVRPEATVTLDGTRRAVGGLVGQPDLAYLDPAWLAAMNPDTDAFHLVGFTTGPTEPRFAWKRARPSEGRPWPPPGVRLTLRFAPPLRGPANIAIDVHYELYSGAPLLAKWLTVRNESARPVRVGAFTAESLAMVEADSTVESTSAWRLPPITVTTDYAFGGDANRAVCWDPDPAYTTQVNYDLKTPCILEVRPQYGPDVDIPAGGSFDTFRVFELLHDGTDHERQGLAIRRMYRMLAPWSTESPLMLHLTSVDPAVAHRAIDQCADVGFEMVILSFGSGLNMEDTSAANIARFRELAEYAHRRGVQLGGYSLLASRRINDAEDVINPATGRTGGAIFDNSPCLGSRWGINYFAHIRAFLEQTGFDLLEHDGSYPGDLCASTQHPGHRGLSDSQWTQHATIAGFYRWCRSRGIYLNVPDWYFLNGQNKTAMGYRETNWSLPRAQQHIHARQNLFDGTWTKAPTMGWMFVPLVEYQGGGAAATIEPLHEHLADYQMHLANNLLFGAQACYRGPRLYDTDQTRALLKRWVATFKKHRAILESDVIHIRRADGRDLDGIVHVNPALPERALAAFWNPTKAAIDREVVVPLHYAGLTSRARISVEDGPSRTVVLDGEGRARVRIRVPAGGVRWIVVKPAG